MVLALAIGVLAVLAIIMASRRRLPERDLRGKVVLITGAGGGFGRLLSLSLAKRGCLIACVDVATKPNQETVDLVLQQQNQAGAAGAAGARDYTVDLSQREAIPILVQKVIKDFGHVDILVSNAGQLQSGKVCDLSDDELDLVLDVNLRATMLLVRALLPHMHSRRSGHLVAVSSVAAVMGHHDCCVYAASKAGLSNYMDCVYREMHAEGLHKDILVTTIHPYFMTTFDRLVHTVNLQGFFTKILPFVDAKRAAGRTARAIASGERNVFIPDHMAFLKITSLVPVSWIDFIFKHLIPTTSRPPINYQYRHREMDADLLFNLLSKGYPLEEDPELVAKGLYDNYLAKGEKLPHDFSPFLDQIVAYYKHKSIPEAVRSVFGVPL